MFGLDIARLNFSDMDLKYFHNVDLFEIFLKCSDIADLFQTDLIALLPLNSGIAFKIATS